MTWASYDKDLDEYYDFTKDFWKANQPVYGKFKPKYALHFGIILPFDLPLGDRAFSLLTHFHDQSPVALTLIFSRILEERNFYAGFVQSKAQKYGVAFTRCEVVYLFDDTTIENDESTIDIMDSMIRVKKYNETGDRECFNHISRVFKTVSYLRDNALFFLNSMIVNYAMDTNDYSVGLVSESNIEFLSHFRGIELDEWKTYNWLNIHSTILFPEELKENITDEEFGRANLLALDFKANQYSKYLAIMQNSRFEYSKGNLASSMNLLNTATEVFVKSIITLYWENEESISIEESNIRIEEFSFKKMLTTILPQIIGGSWDLTRKDTIPGRWYNESYKLRNDLVHDGDLIKDNTVKLAINTTIEFHKYIISLIDGTDYQYIKDLWVKPNIKIRNMGNLT